MLNEMLLQSRLLHMCKYLDLLVKILVPMFKIVFRRVLSVFINCYQFSKTKF